MKITPNNDYHKIGDCWNELKEEFTLLKNEVNSFLIDPGKKRSGIKIRKKSFDVERISLELRRRIVKERQDVNSDYS